MDAQIVYLGCAALMVAASLPIVVVIYLVMRERSKGKEFKQEAALRTALHGAVYVEWDHALAAITGGSELVEKVKRMVEASSSLAEGPEVADLVVSVMLVPQLIATYQDGSTFNTASVRLQFFARDAGQLLSVEFPGVASPPAAKIYRALGAPPTRYFGDLPEDEVVAYMERLLRSAETREPSNASQGRKCASCGRPVTGKGQYCVWCEEGKSEV